MNAILVNLIEGARQCAAAAPVAWRGDRVFRWATMGAGLTLGVLLLNHGAVKQPPPSLSAPDQAGPAPSVPAEPTRATIGGASALPAVAPGQPLGAAPALRPGADAADRFGTMAPPQPAVRARP